jgi:hypothetical protein
MATRAAAEKARATAGKKPPPRSKTKRWWERLLVYPALIGALITAGPQWVDRFGAWKKDVASGSLKLAEEQSRLWKANFDCSQLPVAWYTGAGNVKVDTTTCNSGDVFIRAMTSDSRQAFLWVPLADVFKVGGVGGGGGLIGSAQAATLGPSVSHRPDGSPTLLSLQEVKVLCQKFIDDRHIQRRVQTSEGCFDEVIDTFNGKVVSRTPAPCTCS